MLDFQRIHFFKKRLWKCATSCAQPNCENKSFESDHQIPNQCPIRRFSNSDHQLFWGALSQKEDDFFKNNKLSLKIFWFQALWKPHFENKGNFWINYICSMAFPRGHSHHGMHQGDIHDMTYKGTFASWHTYKGIFASRHTYKGTFAHLQGYICIMAHLQGYICIMAHLQGYICIMAHPQGGVYIMTYIHEHLHHDIPTRGHLHHGIPTWAFASWHAH